MQTSSPPVRQPRQARKSRPCSALLVLNPHRQSRNRQIDFRLAKQLDRIVPTLPAMTGESVFVELRPRLSVHAGKLLSHNSAGTAVYAASFIRERRIVLDTALLRRPPLFRAILAHELFHFVWVRLGNPLRASFSQLLAMERRRLVPGELGESSAVSKSRLPEPGRQLTLRQWKHYVCESFCDSASFLLTGIVAGEDIKLSPQWINRRRKWFDQISFHGLKF